MEIYTFFKDFLPSTLVFIGFLVAWRQYSSQQKFKRLQNLSALWKSFSDNDDLLSLFDTLNELESGNDDLSEELKKYDRKIKLKYLSLIEEAALYANAFEVDSNFAKYLFQWHFYFPYLSPKTSAAFWANIGGPEEMNASYWQKSRDFAAQCKPI